MAQQYSKTWKQCATCTYWTGPRSVDSFGERVTVDSPMTTGVCVCNGNGWKGRERQANQDCPAFEKWKALR